MMRDVKKRSRNLLLMVSGPRAQIAVYSIRHQGHKDVLEETTLKEANALIKKTRVEESEESSCAVYKWTFVLILN